MQHPEIETILVPEYSYMYQLIDSYGSVSLSLTSNGEHFDGKSLELNQPSADISFCRLSINDILSKRIDISLTQKGQLGSISLHLEQDSLGNTSISLPVYINEHRAFLMELPSILREIEPSLKIKSLLKI